MVFIGLVVQLVRIHACHAWGRGFESRPDRKIPKLMGFLKIIMKCFKKLSYFKIVKKDLEKPRKYL